jgi:phosphoglycolate phosphatase
MGKKYLLFDLDGTLTDPKEGITKAAQYALKNFDIVIENRDELIPLIGPPLRQSFEDMYGLKGDDALKAVDKYREYFSETGIFENKIFDGIAELLREQKELGKTLVLATSKPTGFAVRILKHFGIYDYFSFIAGSESDGTRTPKDEIIKYALESVEATPENAVMIGDRMYDVSGAKKNGVQCVGVLFGYGSRRELASAGAEWFAESVGALSTLLKTL